MKKLMLTILLVVSLCSLFYAQKATYVGAKNCKKCHMGAKNAYVYEKWEKAVHAKAFETLKSRGEEKNPQCLICHVTGFNEGGYKLGATNARDFEGIQCESCHGPGSLYKNIRHMKDELAAVENGLIIPVNALCIKCHNKNCPSYKGFNYQNYVKKITHAYRGIQTY